MPPRRLPTRKKAGDTTTSDHPGNVTVTEESSASVPSTIDASVPVHAKTSVSANTTASQKRGRAASSAEAPAISTSTTKKSKTQPLPLRSPLPQRAKQVTDPAGPDKPRPKRTSAEVAAAAKRKAEYQERLAMLEKQKIEMLAQMEIEEMMAQEADDCAAVMSISDHLRKDDKIETTPQDEVDEPMDIDEFGDEGEAETPTGAVGKKIPTAKKQKTAKHQTRSAVDEAKERLLKANAVLKSANAATKSTIPSGLVANWDKKCIPSAQVPAPSGHQQKGKGRAAAVSSESPVVGGLEDGDVFDDGPISEGQNTENDFATISDDGSDIASQPKVKSVSHSSRSASHAPKRSTGSKPVKAKISAASSLTSLSSSPAPGTATSMETDNLPEFARAGWVSVFLPTLYHRWATSEKPWELCKKTPLLLQAIQEVVDTCFPHCGYYASGWDVLCLTAYK
ncbi:hypothetical protein BV22DRAFT_1134858 [Leucogyrophana mollusca]|uniref:Uncharacterized protein n=1 Tax=Leucogyrophana mollusca TaxID=85980 RepID=A0ACB8AXS1_9AGAM|nr:hypothetical protein BV22DRAFT_1134858 [Leucogyrophana mollusca]